jgi:hypothetical protein
MSFWDFDPGIRLDENMVLTKEAAWKDRHGAKRRAGPLRNDVRREGYFSNIEFVSDQHTLVTVHTITPWRHHANLERLQREARQSLDHTHEERDVPIVPVKRNG